MTMVLRLAVLALAIFAVTPWDHAPAGGHEARLEIASADDAVSNGLKILDQAPAVVTPVTAPAGDQASLSPVQIQLRSWNYTAKGKGGSPKG